MNRRYRPYRALQMYPQSLSSSYCMLISIRPKIGNDDDISGDLNPSESMFGEQVNRFVLLSALLNSSEWLPLLYSIAVVIRSIMSMVDDVARYSLAGRSICNQ